MNCLLMRSAAGPQGHSRRRDWVGGVALAVVLFVLAQTALALPAPPAAMYGSPARDRIIDTVYELEQGSASVEVALERLADDFAALERESRDLVSLRAWAAAGLDAVRARQSLSEATLRALLHLRVRLDPSDVASIVALAASEGERGGSVLEAGLVLHPDSVDLLREWGRRLRPSVPASRASAPARCLVAVTLVLNGLPWLSHQLATLRDLRPSTQWLWVVVEGAVRRHGDGRSTGLAESQSPSRAHAGPGNLSSAVSPRGWSVDGTTEWLDRSAHAHPDQVVVVRLGETSIGWLPENVVEDGATPWPQVRPGRLGPDPDTRLWRDKTQMANAALRVAARVLGPALLHSVVLQLDADELWTAPQWDTLVDILSAPPSANQTATTTTTGERDKAPRSVLTTHPTCALFHCHFVVGPPVEPEQQDAEHSAPDPAFESVLASATASATASGTASTTTSATASGTASTMGPRLVVDTLGGYGHSRSQEWLRAWRYSSPALGGFRWLTHAPPVALAWFPGHEAWCPDDWRMGPDDRCLDLVLRVQPAHERSSASRSPPDASERAPSKSAPSLNVAPSSTTAKEEEEQKEEQKEKEENEEWAGWALLDGPYTPAEGGEVQFGRHCVSHEATEARGLVFTHFAYALESQVRFKEAFYGYDREGRGGRAGALSAWESLAQWAREAAADPCRTWDLHDAFPWVPPGRAAVVHEDLRSIGSSVGLVRVGSEGVSAPGRSRCRRRATAVLASAGVRIAEASGAAECARGDRPAVEVRGAWHAEEGPSGPRVVLEEGARGWVEFVGPHEVVVQRPGEEEALRVRTRSRVAPATYWTREGAEDGEQVAESRFGPVVRAALRVLEEGDAAACRELFA